MLLRQGELDHLLDLYEQNRFLDAWEVVRDRWGQDSVARLSVEEIVHAGRLAGRLGNDKVRRGLFRLAWDREPEHPLVRYFAFYGGRRRMLLLDQMREFEERPRLDSGDPALDASFLSDQARVWARFRQFERAYRLLEEAESLGVERAWILVCRAEVLLIDDRWPEATRAAKEAWETSPGLPAASALLGDTLTRLGRREEAVELLTETPQPRQSYETLIATCVHTCGLAERSDDARRRELAATSLQQASELERLAPLADRETTWRVALARLDAASLLGDRPRMQEEAEKLHSPYYRSVLENLRARPDGRRLVLPHRPLFQKHDTCLPASIATVASAHDVELDVDELARALTYDGTPLWLANDWLLENGFATRIFTLTPERCRSALDAGLSLVIVHAAEDWAHAMAVVGMDEAAGTILVHDPSRPRWHRILIDRLADGEAPLGPEAMALVPTSDEARLEIIPEEACLPARCLQDYFKEIHRGGPAVAKEALSLAEERASDHPVTRRLRAIHLAATGELFAALEAQEAFLGEHPDCIHLRNDLLRSLHRTRDTAQIRRTLERIVRRGRVPGIQQDQTWRFPPTAYVARYADYLSLCPEDAPRAETLLTSALRRDPYHAEGCHILGDILARQRRHADAVLPLRLAARLEDTEDHYARAAADALRLTGREQEGLDDLRSRVERLGRLRGGDAVWMALVRTLEAYGRPEEAVATMEEAEKQREDDPSLASQATSFWARMGRWDGARKALERVESSPHRVLYLQAAVEFHLAAGEWRRAAERAEEWIAAAPDDLDARRRAAWLHAHHEGRRGALELTRRWAAERSGDDDFEELHLEYLSDLSLDAEREAKLAARIERNPRDSWAWARRGFAILQRAGLRSGEERSRLLDEAEDVIRHHAALDPYSSENRGLEATLRALRGDLRGALDHLQRAIELEPSSEFFYHRVFELGEDLPEEELRPHVERLRAQLLAIPGNLHPARQLALDIAERFGLEAAEEAVREWQRERPDDPEVIEACADLLLHRGLGREDARRAIEILEPAVRRFPCMFDLQFSLAQAFAIDLREEEEEAVWRSVLSRQPTNTPARRHLARLLARRDRTDEAIEVLETGVEMCPLDSGAWSSFAELLWHTSRHDDAIEALSRGVRHSPENTSLRETLIDRLLDAGRGDEAIRVAREGTEVYPDGAYLWYLLASALNRSPGQTSIEEIESAYRRALELNHTLFAAADELAALLAGQQRFESAREALGFHLESGQDAQCARGRLAWLSWEEGDPDRAIDDMAAVVSEWPLYRWGWGRLLSWLEEREDWPRIRRLLGEPHPGHRDDPSFQARRLELLEMAGEPRDGLDGEWVSLLENFPDHESLHLRRVDQLLARSDVAAAGEILDRIVRFHPTSVYVLARQVQRFCEEGREDDVFEAASQLWQAPGDDSTWPDETSWDAVRGTPFWKRIVERAHDLAMEGVRLRPRAFQRLVDLTANGRAFPRREARRRLAALLERLLPEGDARPRDLATLLEGLHEMEATKEALHAWEEHRELFRRHTPLWQVVGYLLYGDDERREEARDWLREWRERDSVEMYAVTYYLRCLRPADRTKREETREEIEEIYRSAEEALRRIRHDHTARYIATVACEAALRTGRDREFLALHDGYRDLIAGRGGGHWSPGDIWPDPDVLPLFESLLTSDDDSRVGEWTRELSRRCRSMLPWIYREWFRRARPRLGRLSRIWLAFRLSWNLTFRQR